ncbi:MAG: hypothetical protein JXR59_10185 [Desulfuromonadaceae bacterium]|nr:hypothetical protein [Desulfuromonadaceae bacterium]
MRFQRRPARYPSAVRLWPLVLLLVFSGDSLAGAETLELKLSAKDPASWQCRPERGSGTLQLENRTGCYQLDARNLRPATDYALTTHSSSDPQHSAYWLATATSDADGTLQIRDHWQCWGDKVWLVPTADIRGTAGDHQPDRLCRWRPSEYLFEERLLSRVMPSH